MKVLIVNGSPRKEGNTALALGEAARALEECGVETETVQLDGTPIHGCMNCRKCSELGKCVFDGDIVNKLIAKMAESDGLIVGSPTYFAGANGALLAVLDRMFYAGSRNCVFKPASGIAVARRGGTTPTIDQINKYFQICNMPVVSTTYWPMVHGREKGEASEDLEGLQAMRQLGRNMAWLLQCIEAGKENGIDAPELEPKITTSFVR